MCFENAAIVDINENEVGDYGHICNMSVSFAMRVWVGGAQLRRPGLRPSEAAKISRTSTHPARSCDVPPPIRVLTVREPFPCHASPPDSPPRSLAVAKSPSGTRKANCQVRQ